jgi:hypothetical protein
MQVASTPGPVTPVAEHDALFKVVTREKQSFWKGEISEVAYAAWKVGEQAGYTSIDDAFTAAKTFSQGEMPTVAVVRDGARFTLRGVEHQSRVMYGVNDTGVTKHWKFDDYDAKGAVRIAVLSDALVGLVDDSWDYRIQPGQVDIKP